MSGLVKLPGVEIKIDANSPEHSYLQLARQLRERIAVGEITSKLPSLTKLAEQSGLAVGTVQHSIKVLVEKGLVYTVPGRGTFLTHPRESRTSPAARAPSQGRRAALGRPDRSAGPPRPHNHIRH